MSCDRYTTAIADHACGAELAPDAAAHLRTCAACATLLATQRRAIDGLDGELQQLLAIEPSAHFVPRVQAHAAAARAPRPRLFLLPRTRLFSLPRTRLFSIWGGLAAAAAVAIAAFALTVREPRHSRPVDAAVTSTATTPSAVGGPKRGPESVAIAREGSATSVESGGVQPRRRPRVAPASAAAREPDVLVPPGQMQAVERYVALLRSGRLETSKLDLEKKTSEAPVPTELVLGPLEIGPMTVTEIDATTPSAVERRHEQERGR